MMFSVCRLSLSPEFKLLQSRDPFFSLTRVKDLELCLAQRLSNYLQNDWIYLKCFFVFVLLPRRNWKKKEVRLVTKVG